MCDACDSAIRSSVSCGGEARSNTALEHNDAPAVEIYLEPVQKLFADSKGPARLFNALNDFQAEKVGVRLDSATAAQARIAIPRRPHRGMHPWQVSVRMRFQRLAPACQPMSPDALALHATPPSSIQRTEKRPKARQRPSPIGEPSDPSVRLPLAAVPAGESWCGAVHWAARCGMPLEHAEPHYPIRLEAHHRHPCDLDRTKSQSTYRTSQASTESLLASLVIA